MPVRVFAPATVSNLGPGFDVIGLALERPGDVVEAEPSDEPGVVIAEITGDDGALSADPGRNVAGIAAAEVLARLPREGAAGPGRPILGGRGVRLRLHKQMPPASGLGSSGASAAAAAVAVNVLFGRPLPSRELILCAMEGERAACGAAHADNVAPAVLGGIVVVRSYDPFEVVQIQPPAGLQVIVARPHCALPTREARALVNARRYELRDIVSNLGNLAALVSALHTGDLSLVGRAVSDRLVEPVRAELIPGFSAVKSAALGAGALGCSISGAGPSLFALADAEGTARAIAASMRDAFRASGGVDSDTWLGPINTRGAQVL